MHIAKLLGTILGLTIAIAPPAAAVRLANGTVSFVQSPRLLAATTPHTDTRVGRQVYYFTIDLPSTAGEPLQSVTFFQVQGTTPVLFAQENSFAFEGTRDRRGPKLTLKPEKTNPKTTDITVTFDPPVPPGKTVTIGLRPANNPSFGGVYLFGVSAFPSGERAVGQFLGYGRLQFYQDGSQLPRPSLTAIVAD